MPNGGPDCCGNCSYNRAVQEMAHPHPEQRKKFWDLSYCTLREVNITNPFWTYCRNFTYGKRPEERDQTAELKGGISASGLYEGYVRIPWDGKNEPRVCVPTICDTCQRKTTEGIVVEHEDKSYGFCTNRHYVEWWKTMHPDNPLNPARYQSPEERYKDED